MQNAELENVEQPLLMGEVAGAKRVTERGFEEIDVAGAKRVTERGFEEIEVAGAKRVTERGFEEIEVADKVQSAEYRVQNAELENATVRKLYCCAVGEGLAPPAEKCRVQSWITLPKHNQIVT